MSKQSQLREYQNSILARLEDAKKSGAGPTAGYLGVVIGSKNVLVNLKEISETLPITDIHVVPLVKPWFLGVANVRGVIYAINDLAQLVENTLTQVSSNARLLLISESVTNNVAFLVDRLVGLRKLEDMQLGETMAEESLCLNAQTYQDRENHTWYLLDCYKLVNSKDFVTPYLN
ncbi:CheW Chemotaxis signal transduction protein [Methylophilaceae bacterium]|jgi:twitching motility protein PilI